MQANRTPGFYELVYEHDSGGLFLAALIARKFERTLWLFSTAAADDMHAVACTDKQDGHESHGLIASKMSSAFSTIRAQGRNFDLYVIDDLSSLLPDHSGSRHVAKSLQRAVVGWEPSAPVLVLNQERHPAPVGGLYWRQRRVSRRLITIRDGTPLLLSWLQEGPERRFLIWYPWGKPQFRRLSRPEQVVLLRGLSFTQSEPYGEWIV